MTDKTARLTCEFEKNGLIQQLYGPNNTHLDKIESRLGVTLHTRGNTITIEGSEELALMAQQALESLYGRLEAGQTIDNGDVDGAARLAEGGRPSAANEDVFKKINENKVVTRIANLLVIFFILIFYFLHIWG